MRVALEVPAVLESPRLALVDVQRHHARLGLAGDDAPFAPCGKAGTAQTAQAGVFHDLGHVIARSPALEAVANEVVAAVTPVLGVADVGLYRAACLLALHRGVDRIDN